MSIPSRRLRLAVVAGIAALAVAIPVLAASPEAVERARQGVEA